MSRPFLHREFASGVAEKRNALEKALQEEGGCYANKGTIMMPCFCLMGLRWSHNIWSSVQVLG